MTLLTTTDELAELCADLAREPFVAIDTEFMRDRTYWPKLCLVQLAGETRHAAVDPLAPEIDLAPLFELMADPAVLKVFHAARQDIEIFYHLTGADAGAVVRHPARRDGLRLRRGGRLRDPGRAAHQGADRQELALHRLGAPAAQPAAAELRARRRDPPARGLPEARAAARGRPGAASWVAQELAELTNPATYRQEPEEAWRRIKVRSRDPRFLAIVQALAAWRERTAQARDLPRNRVLRDDLLLEVAANRPTSQERARQAPAGQPRPAAAPTGVVEAIQAALALPQAELPRLEPPPKPPRGLGPMIDLLRVLLKLQCEEHHVAQRLVATSGDLEAIAAEDAPAVAALKGWRYEVFGRAALALKRGELGARDPARPPRRWCRCATSPSRHEPEPRRVRPRRGRILIVGRDSFLARQLHGRAAGRAGARGRPRRDRASGPARRRRLRDQLRSPSAARPRRTTSRRRWTPTCGWPRRIGERSVAYLMLSSRKVYAPAAGPLAESAPTAPGRRLRPRTSSRPSSGCASCSASA